MGKKFILYNGKSKIVFPIVPESYEVVDSWDNQELNITDIGLITMIGKRGLKSITFSSFFPASKYSFVEPGSTMSGKKERELVKTGQYGRLAIREYATYHPWNTVKKLQAWRGKVLTFSISSTEGRVSWPCVIDGDFSYGERDHTGDVYFTITLKEYKRTQTKRTVTAPTKKASKPAQKSNVLTYTTKKGDTLKIASKKMTGASSYAKTIYSQNKAACKKAFKKYKKKLSKANQKKYKKKAKINKPMPKGVKLTLRNADKVISASAKANAASFK